jgi:HSP20 family protein
MAAKELLKRKGGRSLLPRLRSESPVDMLQRQMNRMFDDFWLEPFGAFEPWAGEFVPAVDVTEDEKEIRVSAELPGMEEKDIDVTVSDSMLTIQGEKKQEEEEKEKGFYRRETSYGSFRRVVDLPAEVDQSKADAEFKKGILKIKLPKTPESKAKSKKIKVKPG